VPSIDVDNEVYKELQVQAEPFVDTPNTVLRRLLDLDVIEASALDEGGGAGAKAPSPADVAARRASASRAPRARARKAKAKESTRTRAPSGALLPEDRYELPLLVALAERGGKGSSRDVIASVGEQLKEDLMPMDKEALKSGGIRWQSRVQFVRLRLIERGLVAKDTPRGTWGLTDAGMDAAKEALK
jgi:hypothetical protein